MMNKNSYLRPAIILVMITVFILIGICFYSYSEKNIKLAKKEISVNCLIENTEVEEKDENGWHKETKIVFKETDEDSEKEQHYKLFVDLSTEYIDSQDWQVKIIKVEEEYQPKFTITKGEIDCRETASENRLISKTVKREIDGRIYCIESKSEGAAGTIYAEYSYATNKNDHLVIVSGVIRYSQCMNYSEPEQSQCMVERERFDIDKIIGCIVDNLRIDDGEK